MSEARSDRSSRWTLPRRSMLKAGAAGLAGVLTTATGAASRHYSPAVGQDDETLVFLSTQLSPEPEAKAMRERILAGFDAKVDFVTVEDDEWLNRLTEEANEPRGTVGLFGAQHGDFSSLVDRGLLVDLSVLAARLSERRFFSDYVAMGRFAGDAQAYIPWMHATYILAARREALDHLPDGITEESLETSLTYADLAAWASRINDAVGPKFGLPAGETGLIHRFLQGYGYPSFTGGVNTTFASEPAMAMWSWLRAIWEFANPASTTYEFMQEPLKSGDVWIAWDHAARLIEALRDDPEAYITFPAPRGPIGLGYMPVMAGLGVPKNAPNPERSFALIDYLTRPDVQLMIARELSFFPVIEAATPEELPPGTREEADAIFATLASDRAIPSLLPVGLGDLGPAYNGIFRTAFQRIVIERQAIPSVLAEEAANVQAILNEANAACWAPDPRSDGVCRVG